MAFVTIERDGIEWSFHVKDEGGYVTVARNNGPHEQIVQGCKTFGATVIADAASLNAKALAWLASGANSSAPKEVPDGEYFAGL